MTLVRKRIYSAVLTLLVLGSGLSLRADDTEVFFGTDTATPITNPNVLLVIDTSGSMAETITTTTPYNPATIYVGSCDITKIYYRRSSDSAITCSTSNYATLTDFHCAPGITSFASVGYYQDAGIRWRMRISDNQYSWHTTFGGDSTYSYTNHITCLTNNGSSQYPFRGVTRQASDRYAGTSVDNYWSGGTREMYHFYSANYLNYLTNRKASTHSRMEIVKKAVSNLIDSAPNLNIGIMRYDSNGSGGMMIQPIQPVAASGDTLKSSINAMHACGSTPLSETLYEAYQYFSGGPVGFGNASYEAIADDLDVNCKDEITSLSVATSRVSHTVDGANYRSPITASCQQNHIVFLTNGLAQQDSSADTAIDSLPGAICYDSQSSMWSALGVAEPSRVHDGGLCLKSMAQYMASQDMSMSFADKQHVHTHFISFENEVAGRAAREYLRDAARAGGGDAYSANDHTELTSVLQQIATDIREESSSFVSPQLVVNAFNKTQVLEDLYIAMFTPSKTRHWPGNVKKFKLRNGEIVGRGATAGAVDTVSAVDLSTGFFTAASLDFWQQANDDNTNATTKGGAANMIPDPVSRKIYTYIGPTIPSSPVPLASHPFSASNTAITDGVLAIRGTEDPTREALINWARGDSDGDLATTGDARKQMGDPIHSQPAVVVYGNSGATTAERINDAVVYITTNDGYLHAIDVVTGTEIWAFIPFELIGQLKKLHTNTRSSGKHYSLDGDLRVLKYDAGGDGKVNAADGDRVFLYFSQGRGGPMYYALDVTLRDSPKFLWSLGKGLNAATSGGPTDLHGVVDQSWSTPTLGRIKVGTGDTQNSQRLVLIIGGGYDDLEEFTTFNKTDSYGNALFIVDAVKGTVLWSQTKTRNGAFSKMTHAIPSGVTALDINGDGWTDRMYVGDMAGQVWRFDVHNGASNNYMTGNETGIKLVSGGVIASLGGKESEAAADNRSFYNAPDVAAMVARRDASYFNIAIGSGDRALPRTNNTTNDRFYSIRDYRLESLAQETYDSLNPILDSDLIAVTGTAPATVSGTVGWKLPLEMGEKSLSQSLTIDGVILFTTYIPPFASTPTCKSLTGGARSYAIKIADAEKQFAKLYESFESAGLPIQISVVNEGQVIRTDGTIASSRSTRADERAMCMSGVVVMNHCVEFGRRVKTFWQESGAR